MKQKMREEIKHGQIVPDAKPFAQSSTRASVAKTHYRVASALTCAAR
jgi:hypothetical protein